ncbi:hypothetical protein [Streptomyces sp. TR02-1]|uniref:hypothetical protein n=1 Tax=Streptomyces sp. TR02-1 TaxID=3385977 RepID=UPI0039A061B7
MSERDITTGQHVTTILGRGSIRMHKGVVAETFTSQGGDGGSPQELAAVDCLCGLRHSLPAGDFTAVKPTPLPERLGGPVIVYGDPLFGLCAQKWCQQCTYQRAEFSIEHPASSEQWWFCHRHSIGERVEAMTRWLDRLLSEYGTWEAWRRAVNYS